MSLLYEQARGRPAVRPHPDHPHLPVSLSDAAGNRVDHRYDDAGRLVAVRSAAFDRDIETRTYHRNGSLASATDGRGATTHYDYDDRGRLVTITPPQPRGEIRFGYDGDSARVAQVRHGNGQRVGFGYDTVGNLVTVSDDDTGETLGTFAHDPHGNLVYRSGPGWSQSIDWAAGRCTGSVRREGDDVEEARYTYTGSGSLATHTDATGATGYGYDVEGRLGWVADPGGGRTTFGYDAAGRRTETVFASGSSQRTEYDGLGRPVSLVAADPRGVPVLTVTYDYGEGALLRARTVNSVTTEYAYDGLGRVIRAGEVEFGYDEANNLVRIGATTFDVNPAGQHVRFGETILGYDGAGNFVDEVNPTVRFTYSPTNQTRTGTVEGTQVVDIRYDGLDNREPRRITETTVDGRTVTHVLHRTILGITRVTDDGVPTDFVREPSGRLVGLRTADGVHYHVIADHQGSVLALLGGDGAVAATYTYSAFGAVTATAGVAAVNPFRYLGAYQLLRGAHFLECRIYNGAWGRFTQPDPRHQARAPYSFADNDPVNLGNPARTSFWAPLSRPPREAAAAFLGAPVEPTPFIGTGIPFITRREDDDRD
ncbi:RHS repeat-associated core domain-containing protein [Micromonospora matsumotoense]|uniref:RHS repeat-associated core domain-containing protein n=1 Tax=Micromonospora matsumotoense TaxID=121616 RepID=UPI003417D935